MDTRKELQSIQPMKCLVNYSPIEALTIKREFTVNVPPSEDFPQMIVTIPDVWPYIKLGPLYDAHIGSPDQDAAKLERDLHWIANEPYLLTWNGGDMQENANKNSPGASVIVQTKTPNEQFELALNLLKPIQPKILFSIPGNHEMRTMNDAGFSISKFLAQVLLVPYSGDYMFCSLKWRGNTFRLLAHHGSGAAQTAGAQRNAARKDMPWVCADLYWTGHLHQPMTDVVYQTEFDQKTGLMVERSAMSIISPSYVKYFGGYAATKRLAPGVRGLTVATLQEDGRIDVSMHANGKRL
jgi:hypothetical protein